MIIRKANADEVFTIKNIAPTVINESSMGKVQASKENYSKIFEPFIQSGAYYIVAIENNTILGWILNGWNFDFMADEQVGFILDVYVFPPYRRLGVANQLTQYAVMELRKAGFKKAQLNIYAGNPSKKVAEEVGFKEHSTVMEMNLE